ncbi:MAG: heavy metal-binding domain-containing protein, partial [Clostridiales bacterium]|nr:heavy metal-binding domain-containing protein [Clostridiales bacterium]
MLLTTTNSIEGKTIATYYGIVSGEILYRGNDILAMDTEAVRKVRGKEISMIFQEPMTSLNPV